MGGEGEDVEWGRELGDGELGELGVCEIFLGEACVPVGASCGGGLLVVVASGDALGERFFRVHGVGGGVERFAEEEGVVGGHGVVGDAHDFAVHVVGVVVDADVVAVGFGHFFATIEADEDGEGHDDLLGLALFFLAVAADEDVEELVGAAEFDVGLDFDGIPALHDGVLEFVEANFLGFFDAVAEIFALEHLLEGDARIEAEDVLVGHFAEPFAVIADFGFFAIEDFESLFGVGFGVFEDFFAGEGRAGGGASGGVADGGGEVADEEDGLVAELLELAEFFEDDGVTEVDVWGGGIDAEFDAEWAVEGKFFAEFFFGENGGGAGEEDAELVVDGWEHGLRKVGVCGIWRV